MNRSSMLSKFVILGALTLAGGWSVRADLPPPSWPPPARDDGQAEAKQLKTLRQAVERHPESAAAWSELGHHYRMYRHDEDAVAAFGESLRLDPAQADILWNLGTVYAGMGDDQAARQQYEKALEVDPNHTGALNNLGSILHKEGRLDDAERLLRRSTQIDGTSWWPLGKVYADQGRWQQAVEAYEHALEGKGWGLLGIALVHGDLGKAQMHLGHDDIAKESLLEAYDAYQSFERHPMGGGINPARAGEVAYLLARLEARNGDPQAALRYLRGALWRDPELREQARREADLEAVRRLPEAAELELDE